MRDYVLLFTGYSSSCYTGPEVAEMDGLGREGTVARLRNREIVS